MRAPPPEVVIILLPLKENTPNSPKVPIFFFLYVDPNASAASSITGISNFFEISRISSIFAGIPYK